MLMELSDALSDGLVDGEVPVLLTDLARSSADITMVIGKGEVVSVEQPEITVVVQSLLSNTSTTIILWTAETYGHSNGTDGKIITVKTTDNGEVSLFVSSGM